MHLDVLENSAAKLPDHGQAFTPVMQHYHFLSCVKMTLKPPWKSPQGAAPIFIDKGAISCVQTSD